MSRGMLSLLLAGLLALIAAGCGSNEDDPEPARTAPQGMTISGPGLRETKPPWRPQYGHLRAQVRRLKLPPVGDERYHIHALLHIYVDGLLSPVPTDIGIDHDAGFTASVHTHDGTGVIHLEASRPHRFTLGDFFAVWGVKLGPAQVGGLRGLGGDRLHFLVNGRTLRDPAAHVFRNDDNVVIAYGPADSFPHAPSTEPLAKLRARDGSALACGTDRDGRRATSCVAPRRPAGDARR